MNKALLILPLAGAALALAGCQREGPEAPLAGAAIGGPFTLTDHNGRTVSESQLVGKYRLVYFGYTFCPDVCPTTLQKLIQGLRSFEAKAPDRAAKVQPILITVDPARDTPEVLKRYVAAFSPRLIGLTGSEAAIADVAKRYGVAYGRTGKERDPNYLVDHSSVPLLFGPDGAPILLVAADAGAEAVAAELDKWVK